MKAKLVYAVAACCSLFLSGVSQSSDVRELPRHLWVDQLQDKSPPIMDRESFEKLVVSVLSYFDKYAAKNRAKITYEIFWDSSSSGAFTLRKDQGHTWHFFVYDGVLRLPYATEDLISSILCHEVGHHLGGYPFKENAWAAAEGQADYFAMHVCLPELFARKPQKNAEYRDRAPLVLKQLCDKSFADPIRRDVCYREAVTVETLLKYEGSDGKVKLSLTNRDPLKVDTTNLLHPGAQCRIDTAISGAMCSMKFQLGYVPGYFDKGQNTPEAELDSNQYVCNGEGQLSSRPSCWYHSVVH
ncbi:MAG: hypothetical protein WCI18_02320 [Pseudomonadota bacterium]